MSNRWPGRRPSQRHIFAEDLIDVGIRYGRKCGLHQIFVYLFLCACTDFDTIDDHPQIHETFFESKHIDRVRIEHESLYDSPKQRTLTTVIIDVLQKILFITNKLLAHFLMITPCKHRLQVPVAPSKINAGLEHCAAIAQFRQVTVSPHALQLCMQV